MTEQPSSLRTSVVGFSSTKAGVEKSVFYGRGKTGFVEGKRPNFTSDWIERRLTLAVQQLETVHGFYQLLTSRVQIPSRRRKALVVHEALNNS